MLQAKQRSIEESKNPKKDVTSTDSAIRYTAYAKRITQIFRAAHRYVAYTSDIGESFRPVAHPLLVKLGYSISWVYVLGDISFETWRAKLRQQGSYYPGLMPWQPQPLPNQEAATQYNDLDWRLVGLKRSLFQSIASMGLPALTIHTTVRYTVGVFEKSASKTLRSIILPSSWSGENTDMYTSVEISDITPGTSGINLTIEDSMSPTSSTIGKLSIYQERKKEERNIHAYGISQIYEEVRKLDEIQMHFEQKRRALGDRFDSRVKGLPTWHRMQVLKLLKEACIQIKAVYEQEEQLLTE